MKINHHSLFEKDLAKISDASLLALYEKTMKLFYDNKNHPSLHTKHITCKREKYLYSIRVSKEYRILYIDYKTHIELFRFVNHKKYERLIKHC
ncbi:hypothetical protein MNB_SM-7-1150 [hydrothermal vent metagenome]|uniref:ParE-like toxin domain-containing protein n=1 Tax=hydrothermal vent metagenome TaxID=652676 RepID=A0A1W1BB44_9ZZZZ